MPIRKAIAAKGGAHPSLWRDMRGVTTVEYALLLTMILLVTAGAYRALGSTVKKQVECAAAFGGNCAAGEGAKGTGAAAVTSGEVGSSDGTGAGPKPGIDSWSSEAPKGGNNAPAGGSDPGGRSPDLFPPITHQAPPDPVTHPGEGRYYPNDTPIDTPKQLPEDYRPLDPNAYWERLRVNVSGPFSEVFRARAALEMATGWLWWTGRDHAEGLLNHWLWDNGEPYRIDPQAMMTDLPSFHNMVYDRIRDGMARDNGFDSGWQSDSVWAHQEADLKISDSNRVWDWYYALNGYQYRVQGGVTKTINGKQYKEVEVDVFKRYNFGNPTGGEPRGDLDGKIWGKIDQNKIAELNAIGMGHDFNVWGRTKMLVPVDSHDPIIPIREN